MAAQASQTSVVNKALSLLGSARTITALTDNSALARLAASLWEATRDEVQADHPWNECIARAALPASGDFTPSSEYAFAYELPVECLRWLPWEEDHDDWFDGEQEGRFLLSNAAAPIVARYIQRVENVALWSPGLTSAIAAKLARSMAKPVTGQTALIDRMDALYQEALSAAKRQDGLATGRRDRRADYRSNWLQSRHRRFSARGR